MACYKLFFLSHQLSKFREDNKQWLNDWWQHYGKKNTEIKVGQKLPI